MGYQLIIDRAVDSGYAGKVEICTYEFSTIPEQFPGEKWLADQILNKHIEEVSKQASKLLWIKVWRDTSPTWQTNYRVEATASASPLAWNLIIIGVLVIAALLITWKIISVVSTIWGEMAAPVKAGIMTVVAILVILAAVFLIRRRT